RTVRVGQFPASLAVRIGTTGPSPARTDWTDWNLSEGSALMWSSRRASAVVAGLALIGLLTGLQPAVAQKGFGRRPIRDPSVAPPTVATGDPTDLGGITVTPDDALKTRLQNKIKLVQDNIHVEDWKTAFETLQELLALPDDVTVVVEVKHPVTGEVTKRFVSVREEAGRLIAGLPPKGAEFYRAQVGPDAAAELKSAEGDPKILARIMQRYLYTDAGAIATEQLATHLLDRGQYSTAALCFEKLIQRSGLEKVPPKTLFKAAIAFHRVG